MPALAGTALPGQLHYAINLEKEMENRYNHFHTSLAAMKWDINGCSFFHAMKWGSNLTLIIYAGKYGTTEKYAQWIAEKIDADIYPVYRVKSAVLKRYDRIIYGGAVYNGRIQGLSFLKKHQDELKKKQMVLFTVGLTMPNDEVAFHQMLDRNLDAAMQDGIKTYHFLGAVDFKKLNPREKISMWLLKQSILKKAKRSPIEADLVEYYNGKLDYSNKKYVEDFVREILENGEGSAELAE